MKFKSIKYFGRLMFMFALLFIVGSLHAQQNNSFFSKDNFNQKFKKILVGKNEHRELYLEIEYRQHSEMLIYMFEIENATDCIAPGAAVKFVGTNTRPKINRFIEENCDGQIYFRFEDYSSLELKLEDQMWNTATSLKFENKGRVEEFSIVNADMISMFVEQMLVKSVAFAKEKQFRKTDQQEKEVNYDERGNVISEYYPSGWYVVITLHEDFDLPSKIITKYGTFHYTYNERERLTKVSHNRDRYIKLEYDSEGEIIKFTNEELISIHISKMATVNTTIYLVYEGENLIGSMKVRRDQNNKIKSTEPDNERTWSEFDSMFNLFSFMTNPFKE